MNEKNVNPANDALTPAELIKKHNADPGHVITDDEMRKLKVGEEAENKDEIQSKIDKKQSEESLQHHENNTYDILDV